MGTVEYRPDYAKFVFTCHPQEWTSIYRSFTDAASKRKYVGDWDASHKTNRWYYNPQQDTETWSIDIWGEWSGIIDLLRPAFLTYLRRLDMRAIVWDASEEAVIAAGQHLILNVTSHNVHLYYTKPAKKTDRRDRGGNGFAIGSHKSDLRITVYKRHREPVAQEFQMKGDYLRRLVAEVQGDFASVADVCNCWRILGHAVVKAGQMRLERVLDAAGIGSYWPVLGPQDAPTLPPAQATFAAPLLDEEGFPDPSDPSHTD